MATTRTSDGVKLLRCTAGTTAFCLDIERVRGVESAERLQRAPRDAAPGLLRSRGTDWPVFAPSRWFGAAARSQGAQIVLLESPHGRFGVLVDRVAPLGRVAADRIVAAPPFGTASGWVSGVFQSDDGPLALMDIHRMNAPEADEFEERPSSAPRVKPAGHAKRAGLSRWLALAGRQRDEVGGRRMAVVVPVSIVVEVIDAPPASPMPGAPAHIQGWIDWRKRPLVVT